MQKMASIFFFFLFGSFSLVSASLSEKMQAARAATVSILTKKEKKPFKSTQGTIFGTGFLVRADGYVVTSAHNLSQGQSIYVKLWDQKEQMAQVVGLDTLTDIAVLKIKADKKLPVLEWANADVFLGQKIFIIGTPFGLEGSVSMGIVSEPNRVLANQDIGLNSAHQISGFIQTDAAMSLGHSGGPMLSLEGDVVGLNTAIVSPTEGSAGLGFAIPTRLVRFIVDQLITHGFVRRLSLGIELQSLSPQIAQYFDLDAPKGALISGIDELGHGYLKGLRVGDLILEINGAPVLSADTIPELLTLNALQKTVVFTLMREGKQKKLSLKILPEMLSPQKKKDTQMQMADDAKHVYVEELTALDRLKQTIPETVTGGIIRTVPEGVEKQIFPNSVLERIDGKPVGDVALVNQKLAERLASNAPVLLHLWLDGRRYFATYP